MNTAQESNTQLEIIARLLIRCFLMGIALIILWFLLFLFGGELIFRIHSSMFAITKPQFDMMMYAGMMFTKVFVFVVFLFPYLAIRMVLSKKYKESGKCSPFRW